MTQPFRTAALYQFTRFYDPAALRPPLEAICHAHDIGGTLLLATEGLNGTIAGRADDLEAVLAHLRTLPGCEALVVKYAWAPEMPFHRMKVRLKKEIVSMGQPGLDPVHDAGTYVAPEDWNALIDRPDTIVIDTRNDYEVAIGTFPGAIDPQTRTFRDFPEWFRANRDQLIADGTKVAMFCTGGIRCEKATAFLKAEGVEDVFHLEGGILNYLEKVPADESRWAGECFVFDERVAVTPDLAPGTHVLCRACRRPVSPQERASPLYEEGVSCPACHADLDDDKRARLAERHRQEALAQARGTRHVGAKMGDD
ncbi:rhodanese-related sulfurtransferase [Sphingomonas mucosissima]|uniref:tRNA uridine(34) hydroxylase n=1 Tax=Sphingomonas mucosissima TaxID=370959 RepID=A0A245ZMD4_9SPHN|nr:rhodanese-related sulfurtransferase [Sphingomonas mucosissima]OWK30906.1 putative rhodanese-related sulfurtransferase [Sphingomonas mucosissima]